MRSQVPSLRDIDNLTWEASVSKYDTTSPTLTIYVRVHFPHVTGGHPTYYVPFPPRPPYLSIVLETLDNLRGHPVRSPHDASALVLLGREGSCEAKVCELHLATQIHLTIAVQGTNMSHAGVIQGCCESYVSTSSQLLHTTQRLLAVSRRIYYRGVECRNDGTKQPYKDG